MNLEWAQYVPWIPGVAALLCGVCCMRAAWRRFAGPICVLSILAGFIITCLVYAQVPKDGGFEIVNFFRWMAAGELSVNFGYFFDPLTLIMMFVVTGIGTLIATYAMGYMKHDEGYARFFAGVALFIFAMTNLVMADNLVLLYLGWEGVGLCSYLLIGHYYKYPVAVNAAKKAFIVNRVGDLGFALGIFLTYMTFGSVNYADIIPAAQAMLADNPEKLFGGAAEAYSHAQAAPVSWLHWIPFLLMLGAFGKSAQLPLHVWLPDAMAGPTPVSALIHAATMVTAGVFMIARLTPIFELSPAALPTVAVVGAITCMFAATIAMCTNDMKGVFAYSTVSQIGYMFIGVGVGSVGGVFHLTTHAFFKALLFLTAGSVMHALAGNLDIKAMSGLRKKMPASCWLMFCGCIALAALPFTSGYFSKDLLLGDAMAKGAETGHWWFYFAATLGLITAGLTAFYTFRVWFRVFTGPEDYDIGDAHHTPDNELEEAMIAVAKEEGERTGHYPHEPHEMPWWPMNAPLVILAFGAVAYGAIAWHSGWITNMLHHSTQFFNPYVTSHTDAHHSTLLGLNPHTVTSILSILLATAGVVVAGFFHWKRRDLVSVVTDRIQPIVQFLYHKYYIDELYDWVIVRPLRLVAHICYIFDQLVIDGLVMLFAWLPRLVGFGIRPTQSGRLQGYGVAMTFGLGIIVLLIFYATTYAR